MKQFSESTRAIPNSPETKKRVGWEESRRKIDIKGPFSFGLLLIWNEFHRRELTKVAAILTEGNRFEVLHLHRTQRYGQSLKTIFMFIIFFFHQEFLIGENLRLLKFKTTRDNLFSKFDSMSFCWNRSIYSIRIFISIRNFPKLVPYSIHRVESSFLPVTSIFL